MSDNKQSIQFDLSYNQGCTCIGCAMIADLIVEEEFSAEEIALMKQLVSQVDDEDYSQGIMPLLKEGAPSLYDRLDKAARYSIFEFLVQDGFRNGYIELDDDELRKNFEQDVEDGADEESYQKWLEQELSDLETMDLDWIRSRYTIEDHVEMEDDPDYTIDIPVDFLPD